MVMAVCRRSPGWVLLGRSALADGDGEGDEGEGDGDGEGVGSAEWAAMGAGAIKGVSTA